MEYARNVAGILDASHAEIDAEGTAVIVPLRCSLVGESRPVRAVSGTTAAKLCGSEEMLGYHFCSYGVAREIVPLLEAAGMVVSGHADDGEIEIVELPDHPFFLGTLFQPQVAEHDASLHPVIVGFWRAVVAYHHKRDP